MNNIQEKMQKVEDGLYCPLLLMSEINTILETLEKIKTELMPFAINQFKNDSCEQKTIKKYGFNISFVQSGRYDYKDIPQWNEKFNELKEIEKKAQQAYKTMQAIDNIQPAIYCNNKPSLSFKLDKKIKL